MVNRRRENKNMDLSLIQKVSELASEGRSAAEIKQELQVGGVAPETADQALREAGVVVGSQTAAQPANSPLTVHHEKTIQPSPGFDPNAQ
jgi:orotate phosphoribosyltransferase-like protein